MKRITFAAIMLATFASTWAKPLKIYILAGQSNMEGHAKVSTIDYIGKDPATAPMLREMLGPDGKPRVCENVWISYYTGRDQCEEGFGKLTTGYGSRKDPTQDGGKIGPEFTFGIYMQKLVNEPILIIKTAWGGKSLNTDFRPPSAGPYEFSEREKADREFPKYKAIKEEKTGKYYRYMMSHIRNVLADIKRVCPVYDEKEGYELAGFVWFQGWNDMCDGGTYPKRNQPDQYDLYSELLAHFIRDVRKELSAPDMRFVIGVMGVGGPGKQKYFRKAMEAPTEMPEFKGNVVAVRTDRFWDFALETAAPRKKEYEKQVDTAHFVGKNGWIEKKPEDTPGWKAIGTPRPEERVWRFVSFNPQRVQDKLPVAGARRFREVQLPAGMEKWYDPSFDDSKWDQGKAPIGMGNWRYRRNTVQNRSDWGTGEFLLMRTKFSVDSLNYEAYRLSVLARQGFSIYLNGHLIHKYIWWKNDPYYRAIILKPNEVRHLREGENVLAAYANNHMRMDDKTLETFASIDMSIEGIDKAGMEYEKAELEKVFSQKDRETLKGASNAAYHYMGSAKILGQIGKAFAEAMAE
jgi:hypothetical protein